MTDLEAQSIGKLPNDIYPSILVTNIQDNTFAGSNLLDVYMTKASLFWS